MTASAPLLPAPTSIGLHITRALEIGTESVQVMDPIPPAVPRESEGSLKGRVASSQTMATSASLLPAPASIEFLITRALEVRARPMRAMNLTSPIVSRESEGSLKGRVTSSQTRSLRIDPAQNNANLCKLVGFLGLCLFRLPATIPPQASVHLFSQVERLIQLDPSFSKSILRALALKAPAFLIEKLSLLPVHGLNREEQLALGSMLESPAHRMAFASHCRMQISDIDQARQHYMLHPSTQDSLLLETIETLRPIFRENPYFLFIVTRDLAQFAPEFLCRHLDLFPLEVGRPQELLQIGSFLPMPEQRRQFAEHFGFSSASCDEAYRQCQSMRDVSEPTCFGHTLIMLSQTNPRPSTQTRNAARIVQGAYRINSHYDFQHIGRDILTQPDRHSRILAMAERISHQAEFDIQNPTHCEFIGKIAIRLWASSDDKDSGSDRRYHRLLDRSSAPVSLMQRLHLRQGPQLIPRTPLHELSTQLSALRDQGVDHLCLELLYDPVWREEQNIDFDGHAVYVSFNPPSFCDNEDRDPRSGVPILRRFESVDEMIQAFQFHLALYSSPSQFSHFEATRYDRVPTSLAAPAPASHLQLTTEQRLRFTRMQQGLYRNISLIERSLRVNHENTILQRRLGRVGSTDGRERSRIAMHALQQERAQLLQQQRELWRKLATVEQRLR